MIYLGQFFNILSNGLQKSIRSTEFPTRRKSHQFDFLGSKSFSRFYSYSWFYRWGESFPCM